MENNVNTNTQPTENGAGGAAANQPANTAANAPQSPNMDTLAQTLIDAVQKRTARAEKSVVQSIADQYGMNETEVAAILSKARDEKAKALPDDVQKRIDEANERGKKRLIRSEVKALGNAMGLADVEAAMMMMDMSKITVADDDEVQGVQEQLDALKTAKAWLFPQQTGAAWGQKQSSSPAKTTKADIMKIRDPIERQNQIAKNLELFK